MISGPSKRASAKLPSRAKRPETVGWVAALEESPVTYPVSGAVVLDLVDTGVDAMHRLEGVVEGVLVELRASRDPPPPLPNVTRT